MQSLSRPHQTEERDWRSLAPTFSLAQALLHWHGGLNEGDVPPPPLTALATVIAKSAKSALESSSETAS